MTAPAIVPRPEFVREQLDSSAAGQVQQRLTPFERVWNIGGVRKASLLVVLVAIWQIYATLANNPLMFPTFSDTVTAWWDAATVGKLLGQSLYSLRVLLIGYGAGIAIATVMTILAISSRIGNDLLETLTAMFNPLPAIAMLPLALLWFGLGLGSLVFVLIHSVLWPVSLNMHSGFKSVSNTLRMVGGNYGLTGFRYVARILVPAAFPAILTGLKIGWAFAWRTLIAAELVFGVSSGAGGLGWFIYENKNQLEIPSVFAGLLTVIVIGLAVENLIFRTVEQRTVRRWGMSN